MPTATNTTLPGVPHHHDPVPGENDLPNNFLGANLNIRPSPYGFYRDRNDEEEEDMTSTGSSNRLPPPPLLLFFFFLPLPLHRRKHRLLRPPRPLPAARLRLCPRLRRRRRRLPRPRRARARPAVDAQLPRHLLRPRRRDARAKGLEGRFLHAGSSGWRSWTGWSSWCGPRRRRGWWARVERRGEGGGRIGLEKGGYAFVAVAGRSVWDAAGLVYFLLG